MVAIEDFFYLNKKRGFQNNVPESPQRNDFFTVEFTQRKAEKLFSLKVFYTIKSNSSDDDEALKYKLEVCINT